MPPPPIPCPLPPQAHDTGVLDCPDEPVLEVSGCQQMVAGTNVRVWMNVTCPDTKGREVKINLHMDLYEVIGDADGDIDMQVGTAAMPRAPPGQWQRLPHPGSRRLRAAAMPLQRRGTLGPLRPA